DTPSDPHGLPDVFYEHLPFGAVSPQRDRRVGLKRPVGHLATGILDVHVEIGVGALPVQLREYPGELFAVLAVELRVEGVMRKRRRRQQNQTTRHRRRAKNSRNLHRNLHRPQEPYLTANCMIRGSVGATLENSAGSRTRCRPVTHQWWG